jgi:TRAP-type C4-dicarboxylate transport system permease large subunit
MILVGAMVFNLVVARIQAIETLTSWAMHPMLPPWLVIVASMILLIGGGMIFESGAMITIVTPIIVPIVVALGFNEVWMGILMTINCEIAQMSPPVGIVLYALYAALGGKMNLTMEDVMKGALPFMIPLMITLILVGLFPRLSLWLPSILMGR